MTLNVNKFQQNHMRLRLEKIRCIRYNYTLLHWNSLILISSCTLYLWHVIWVEILNISRFYLYVYIVRHESKIIFEMINDILFRNMIHKLMRLPLMKFSGSSDFTHMHEKFSATEYNVCIMYGGLSIYTTVYWRLFLCCCYVVHNILFSMLHGMFVDRFVHV